MPKSNFKQVKTQHKAIRNEIAEIGAKTGVASRRFYNLGGDPEDVERIPLSSREYELYKFTVKSGINIPYVTPDPIASYRTPNTRELLDGIVEARGRTKPILTSKRQLRKNIDLRKGSETRKSSARPNPGKKDIVVHEEPGFRAWRSANDKSWLTYQYKEQDGRTVTVKKRSNLLDQALDYQKSIEGRRFFGGGEVSRDMAKAFKHVWYATGDRMALTMKWMNIANAWRRRLLANGFIREARALVQAMQIGDPRILEGMINHFNTTLGDAVVEELFNYENTLEHGQYDEYLMMDE